MALVNIVSRPFVVSGESLTIPGPRVWNGALAQGARTFINYEASELIINNTTSLTGAFTISTSLPDLKLISFNSLTSTAAGGDISVTGPTNLEVFEFAQQLTAALGDVVVSGGKLTADSVNAILINLAEAVRLQGGTTAIVITLNGGTNASPTGAGITAKDYLTTAGATVTVN